MHVELNNQYEEKLKKTILYIVHKIDWLAFYDQLVGILDMWNDLKRDEDTLNPSVQKWSERDKDITLMCFSIIHLSCEKIEKTFDINNNLKEFDETRVSIQKRIIICLSKYIGENFDLSPVHSKGLIR